MPSQAEDREKAALEAAMTTWNQRAAQLTCQEALSLQGHEVCDRFPSILPPPS